jgi:hypothetical protein
MNESSKQAMNESSKQASNARNQQQSLDSQHSLLFRFVSFSSSSSSSKERMTE